MHIAGNGFIVSGGGSGLGAATVRMLVEHGGRVVIADIDEEKGTSLAKELGESAVFCKTDVTDEAQVRAAVDTAVQRFGPLRGSIHCAGIGLAEKLLGKEGPHRLDSFSRVIAVNLVGTFNMLRIAAEAIARTDPLDDGERGVCVNTASVAAFEGQIGQVAYSASKGGVAAMTLPAARELARHGIRVATIAPGIFDTPLLAGLPEPARISLAEQMPFPKRLGQPSEFAQLVRHIVENLMLNGCIIRLDGALRMGPR